MLKIGSHVAMSGTDMFLGSVNEALSYGANSFMIYTGAPQNTRRKPIADMNIEAAHRRMAEAGLSLDDVVVHAPYIMNLANGDPSKRAFAVDFLTSEIERTAALGASQIVLHPGAHVKQGVDVGIAYIIEGLNEVLARTKDKNVKIALETMAGKGTEIGRRFEELKAIIDGVASHERLSVCFDTCHTHDAGYATRDDFDAVLAEFDRVVGIERISVIHVNDSKNDVGDSKDRHANIGFGKLGFAAIDTIVHHPALADVPKILETPYVDSAEGAGDKALPPYRHEIDMLRRRIFDPNLIERIQNDRL